MWSGKETEPEREERRFGRKVTLRESGNYGEAYL